MEKLSNIFWNLIAILVIGGVIAISASALGWHKIQWLLDNRLPALFCIVGIVLLGGALITWAFFPRRGVIIHGQHYEDATWHDR